MDFYGTAALYHAVEVDDIIDETIWWIDMKEVHDLIDLRIWEEIWEEKYDADKVDDVDGVKRKEERCHGDDKGNGMMRKIESESSDKNDISCGGLCEKKKIL